MTKTRLELFSDGVFAIVLTLLVLDLKVPPAHGLEGLSQIAPALVVHAATFFVVGVLWMIHHGAIERVVEITGRTLGFNLLSLFWVTLIPFGARNAAERPFEPLGASLLAFCCGAYLASAMAARLSAHSTIDDNPRMRTWRRGRLWLGSLITVGDLACSGLSWVTPLAGYAAALATVLLFILLPSPPEAERRFLQDAAAAE